VAGVGADGDADDDGSERRPAEPPTNSKGGDAKVELETSGQIVRHYQTREVSPHKRVNDDARHGVPPEAGLTQRQ
jgi:hypothetical protein